MSRHGNLLTYVSFAIVGILLSYNTNFFQVEEVRADQVKPLDLPALKFDPKNNLSLEIDLNKGVSNVKSDMPIANIDVTINHPTKIVEKVVYKKSKPKVVYETKTEVQTRPVMFTLPTPRSHKFVPEYPKSVEK